MVYNLVDRAINLADKKCHQNDILNVEKLLINNSYPKNFIEKHVALRLQKIKFTEQCSISNTVNKKQNKKSIVLPYIEGIYESLSSSGILPQKLLYRYRS